MPKGYFLVKKLEDQRQNEKLLGVDCKNATCMEYII